MIDYNNPFNTDPVSSTQRGINRGRAIAIGIAENEITRLFGTEATPPVFDSTRSGLDNLQRHQILQTPGGSRDIRIRQLTGRALNYLKWAGDDLRQKGFSEGAITEDLARLVHPDAIARGFTEQYQTHFYRNSPELRPLIRHLFKIPQAVLTEAAVVAGVAAPSPRPQSCVIERIIALLRRLRYYFPI